MNTCTEPNVIEYFFQNGLVPISKDRLMQFEDFAALYGNGKVRVEQASTGAVVALQTSTDQGSVIVSDTDEFLAENPNGLLDQFLKILKNSKR